MSLGCHTTLENRKTNCVTTMSQLSVKPEVGKVTQFYVRERGWVGNFSLVLGSKPLTFYVTFFTFLTEKLTPSYTFYRKRRPRTPVPTLSVSNCALLPILKNSCAEIFLPRKSLQKISTVKKNSQNQKMH